ncbi:MAG: hypothetical protein IJL30_01520 [Clostridia bacterium]|nr:hypothetical protein [Clostridia bacterium]
MSLLSKLLGGDKKAEKAAKDFLTGLLGNTQQNTSTQNSQNTASSVAPAARQVSSASSSGLSWGENMPDEENQFNFNGSFTQYFESIFNSEFSSYCYEKEILRGGRRIVYSFYGAAGKILVVELMPESCSAYKLRSDCKNANIGYLRFYYNHEGWWNTRAYVVSRMRNVLNG